MGFQLKERRFLMMKSSKKRCIKWMEGIRRSCRENQ